MVCMGKTNHSSIAFYRKLDQITFEAAQNSAISDNSFQFDGPSSRAKVWDN